MTEDLDPRLTRPLLRYFGGKWRIAPWICDHLPEHRCYVEPFGGAASVLLRKPRSYAEVYNDLDSDVVNLFRVLRGPLAQELVRLVSLTPFAREEFEESYAPTGDPVEQARRMIARSYMGFGSTAMNAQAKTGFRSNSNRSHTTPAHDWAAYPPALEAVVHRLRGVVVENRPAVQVMQAHDSPTTLHYVDPPYLHETRSPGRKRGQGTYHVYAHEMDEADHRALLAALLELEGMVVLSGYASPMYDAALPGWTRIDRKARADGASERTESLWVSPRAVRQGRLL